MRTQMEKRTFCFDVEARAVPEQRVLAGYAAVFDSPAVIAESWVERIKPGAFTNTLGADVRALIDHDSGRVLGRTKSGTLRLWEDERGLRFEVDVPDTSDGRDLWTLVQRGDISGMSFGFRVIEQDWDYRADPPARDIRAVELFEISACTFPAYDDTEIGKRSLQEAIAAAAASVVQEQPSTNRAAVIGARLRMSLALRERELAR